MTFACHASNSASLTSTDYILHALSSSDSNSVWLKEACCGRLLVEGLLKASRSISQRMLLHFILGGFAFCGGVAIGDGQVDH